MPLTQRNNSGISGGTSYGTGVGSSSGSANPNQPWYAPAGIVTSNSTLTGASIIPALPNSSLGMIGWDPSAQDIMLMMNSAENGQDITMTFAPEKNISPFEMMHLTLLMTLMSHGGLKTKEHSLIFIRKHNLERHFKFSQP